MKIAIVGATGKTGRLLMKEALSRGHEVTTFVRDERKMTNPNVRVVEKDVFALSPDDVKGQDVVINAFGTFKPETLEQHQTSLKHLADIVSGTSTRLLVVGGAGSLYVNPEHTLRLVDSPDFPEAARPLAASMAKAFDTLRERNDVKWTYLSPAADFVADGPRTGNYRVGKDELMQNAEGKSQISYADYAIAMIDEVENNNHPNARFTVVAD